MEKSGFCTWNSLCWNINSLRQRAKAITNLPTYITLSNCCLIQANLEAITLVTVKTLLTVSILVCISALSWDRPLPGNFESTVLGLSKRETEKEKPLVLPAVPSYLTDVAVSPAQLNNVLSPVNHRRGQRRKLKIICHTHYSFFFFFCKILKTIVLSF